MKNICIRILALFAIVVFSVSSIDAATLFGRDSTSSYIWGKITDNDVPNYAIEVHKINDLWLAISNTGTFGIGFANSVIDPETSQPAPSCEYPAGSNKGYLFIASFWAGAVVGRDTLVSVGFDGNYGIKEFWPDAGERGGIIRRSNLKTKEEEYHPDAVSEQDFITVYTDTFTARHLIGGEDPIDNRPHIPLGLRVDQRTYGWSYDYAADFIIFDFRIQNINIFPLKDFYFGIYVDADIYHEGIQSGALGWVDDICGYLNAVPSKETPGYMDTIRIAWTADNDGDPNFGNNMALDYSSVESLTGMAVLSTPDKDMSYSYNWWIANTNPALDWGPRMGGTDERPFRDFGGGMGSPDGDLNKYYMMSSGEFDYDQLESAISHTKDGWLGPPKQGDDFADGYDARYLLSFGPFDLMPGDTLPIYLAYVGGQDFHVSGTDFMNYWDPLNPKAYQNKLDFTQFGNNAKWAKWIFDNPGVDTDGDGDSGKVRWIVDTLLGDSTAFFYEGDGVPDLRGAAPPPPPSIYISPEYGRLKVSWNGQITEENIDVFSGLKDFEGYRVYISEGRRLSDYILIASYDRDNYNMYTWEPIKQQWNISQLPLPTDSIAILFGPSFDPQMYDSPDYAFQRNDDYYYFTPQAWNASDLSSPSGIRRVYPRSDINDPFDTTSRGHHRFYEYEFYIENLPPSKPVLVAVTAFDFGSRKFGLSSLESSPNLKPVEAYPLPSADFVEQEALAVQVFPNPYRIDAGYAAGGYENRRKIKAAERARSINFFNLPKVCTIRIYSIDGDLIQEIDHYQPNGGPKAQHERWDIISRNTQSVVTGIYLYHIESEMGEQLGKIVIIK